MNKGFSYFKKLLKYTDIFAQGIDLTLNKSTKSKTLLGGVLSILTIVSLATMFYFNALDVLYRFNPIISIEQQLATNYSSVSLLLNTHTLPLSISLSNNNNLVFAKPNYFKYSARVKYGLTTGVALQNLDLNLTVCNKDNFRLISQDAYDSLNMDQNLCIVNQNFTIGGSWSNHYISYLSLRVALCINNSPSDNCAPYSEIIDFLNATRVFWNIYFGNNQINPQNSDNPITQNLFNFYKEIKLNTFKAVELYIRQQSLQSDDGLIFKTNNTNNSIAYDFNIADESTIKNDTLVEFMLLLSPNKIIYHRSYNKIQMVLAEIGGLANVLRITFTLICYIFSIVKRDEAILNKIFDFDLTGINRVIDINFRKSFQYEIKDGKTVKKTNNRIVEKGIDHDLDNEKENDKDMEKEKEKEKGIFQLSNSISPIKKSKFLNNFFSPVNNVHPVDFNLELEEIKNNSQTDRNIPNTPIYEKSNNLYTATFAHEVTPIPKHNIKTKLNQDNIPREQEYNESRDSNKEYCLDGVNQLNPDTGVGNKQGDNLIKINKIISQKKSDKLIKIKFTTPKQILHFLELRKKRHELKFTFFEIFISFLCMNCCMKKTLKAKKTLYNKSNFAIEDFMDITYIIQKLEEFEKFKIVMFNQDQLALFRFISKEIMSLDDSKVKFHHMSILKAAYKDEEILANSIIKFREKISKNEDVKDIDIKLFNLLYEEFKNFT